MFPFSRPDKPARRFRPAIRVLIAGALMLELGADVVLMGGRSARPFSPVRLAAAGLGTTARVVEALTATSDATPAPAPEMAGPLAPRGPKASAAPVAAAAPVAVPAALVVSVTSTVTPTAAPVPPAPPPDPLKVYRGLGAWVDWFDYGRADSPDPASIVDELVRQGVRTLYLETGLWAKPQDILNPGVTNVFLEQAHAHGIAVVGWYVPGFADIDRDLRASLAVLAYTTPGGQHFDGFAPDIEDRTAIEQASRRTTVVTVPPRRGCPRPCTATVGVDAPATEVLAGFNAAIADYSRRLREAVGPHTTLGAIVVDAKNNQGAQAYWKGYPWPEIAARYDVVLPMAYWSVNKPAGCPPADAAGYIKDVVAMTQALMGTPKPIHPIGGVADCLKAEEVAGFVDATKAAGAIGGSLYDLDTTRANPEHAQFWEALGRLNRP